MEINPPGDIEALVAAAKVPWRDIDPERFADAVEHVAVPGRGFGRPHVPQAQIDVEVRAFDGCDAAKVEDVLQVAFCRLAGEFGEGVCREVHLPNRRAIQYVAPRALDGGAVGGERQLEHRLFQFLEVMYEAGMERRFAEDMEKDILRANFLRSGDALFEKRGRHEGPRHRDIARRSAGAKTAAQIAGIRYFDVYAFHRPTPC